MAERSSPPRISPEAVKALGGVYNYVLNCGLEKPLIDLVFLRASQINGCAFCIDMHARDLIEGGMGVEKILLVPAWREAGAYFGSRERAALAWTETVTQVAETKVPDADLEAAQAAFKDKELADLTLAIGLINLYNRNNVALRRPPASLTRPQAGERARA
ncbi:MAG: carboxymuconolactone decarboxylase family protein [Hyphomicrobiales bacterium]|nr:carboxymuconolactone decarboxylase family protein [Hyphomicrobiales bacterium]